MWIYTIFFISPSELETGKILANRELLQIVYTRYIEMLSFVAL